MVGYIAVKQKNVIFIAVLLEHVIWQQLHLFDVMVIVVLSACPNVIVITQESRNHPTQIPTHDSTSSYLSLTPLKDQITTPTQQTGNPLDFPGFLLYCVYCCPYFIN